MARRFKQKQKKQKIKKRANDFNARKLRRKRKQILTAKQHVINLANIPLNDDQYIL